VLELPASGERLREIPLGGAKILQNANGCIQNSSGYEKATLAHLFSAARRLRLVVNEINCVGVRLR
jgi:hypothetical protein